MQFVYTAKNAAGDIQTGHMYGGRRRGGEARAARAESVSDRRAEEGGGYVLQEVARLRGIKSALSKRDLLSVTTQLAIMTRSGVDLASAFQSLSQQCGNANLRSDSGAGA